jgi:hypothetical protein
MTQISAYSAETLKEQGRQFEQEYQINLLALAMHTRNMTLFAAIAALYTPDELLGERDRFTLYCRQLTDKCYSALGMKTPVAIRKLDSFDDASVCALYRVMELYYMEHFLKTDKQRNPESVHTDFGDLSLTDLYQMREALKHEIDNPLLVTVLQRAAERDEDDVAYLIFNHFFTDIHPSEQDKILGLRNLEGYCRTNRLEAQQQHNHALAAMYLNLEIMIEEILPQENLSDYFIQYQREQEATRVYVTDYPRQQQQRHQGTGQHRAHTERIYARGHRFTIWQNKAAVHCASYKAEWALSLS